MNQLPNFLASHWVGLFLLGIGLACATWLAWRRRRGEHSLAALVLAPAFALAGVAGLTLPAVWGQWLASAGLAVLCLMLVVLILTGGWWRPLGYAVGVVVVVGLGSAYTPSASRSLNDFGATLLSLELGQPGWLVLFGPVAIPLWLLPLGFVPLIIGMSYRSLAGLGPVRRWLAIVLRCSLIVLLTLALCETRIRHGNETVTVLFLVDRSFSVPPEFDPKADPNSQLARTDLRWERIKRFINDAIRLRGAGHDRDQAGVIVFGRRPRLELPPSDAIFEFKEVASTIDSNYTDIGAAIQLALASFPEGTGKRIVLISDGNENLGNAEEQARRARHNGAQIDVVPLAPDYQKENEVLVEGVEAPRQTEQGARLPIRVLIRNNNPLPVIGTLTLRQIIDGTASIVGGKPLRIRLLPGPNSIPFQQEVKKEEHSYTYEAIFQPEGIEANGKDGPLEPLVGDRPQNNRATAHVVARGQRRILLVEAKAGEHQFLIQRLQAVPDDKYKIFPVTVDMLPQNKAELAVFLSNFDCVIMANVAASDVEAGDVGGERIAATITEEQQEVIRSNTHDQGCGLIMIGGPNSFGAGGWQGTAVEKALPVDCELKSIKVQGKSGLVLIMHASEMADGNRWQKEIAKLAIRKLSAADMVGVQQFDWGGMKWHIPFQEIGDQRGALLAKVDSMSPGDMPDFNPGMQMAYQTLMDPRHELSSRHIIIISDGDPAPPNQQLLAQMAGKVTCTTVGVATHGAPQDRVLNNIAKATGGRFYNVKNPRALPAIYLKETRLISQSYIYTNQNGFEPQLRFRSGPTDGLNPPLQPLYGFVRTTLKPSALVEMPIEGPPVGDQRFPILAYWQYGLGRAVAFTSDARSSRDLLAWDRDWAASDMYLKFWQQVLDWSLRAVETGDLTMITEYRDGKVKVIIDAREPVSDAQARKIMRPLSGLIVQGGVTPPNPSADDPRRFELRFEETNSGIYEAEFAVEEAGSYFINATATRPGAKEGDADGKWASTSVRAGVTIPYSPEFAEIVSNPGLLERLRDITGGMTIAEDEDALTQAALSGTVFRGGYPLSHSLQPIWYWLVLLAGLLLLCDVAVRRVAFEPLAVAAAAERVWARLRRQTATVEETPQFLDRLKSRKAQIGETLEKGKGERRFEAPDTPAAATPAGATEPSESAAPVPPPAQPPPTVAPEAEAEPTDFASRLMRAKKRVWEERDKEK
ncbi:MAG: VWA domain-containing protein [Gemmataceae bacterium]